MSTLTVRVCEECGIQSANPDGWLVIAGFDVRSATTGEPVTAVPTGADICSPGCLLRYVSRHLEPAMSGHSVTRQHTITLQQPVVHVA